MSKTVAIYRDTENGRVRVGTFRPRKYYSVRSISEQFIDANPCADPDKHWLAHRRFLMGRWVDDEPVRFDCGHYRVLWDNDADCGTLYGEYRSERAAWNAGAEWKRRMVAIETTAAGKRDARWAYSFEVEEFEPQPELDPEAAPDNPRPGWA